MENQEIPTAPETQSNLDLIDKSPEELSSDVPIFLVQGWGETPITHEQTIETINSNKRRALMVKFPRKGKLERTEEYPAVELNKAKTVLKAIEQSGASKVDVIAHSEGALATMIAVDLEPEKFRNIVFVDPAGIIGQDDTVKLAARFTHMLTKDAARLFIGFKGKFRNGVVKAIRDFSITEAVKPRNVMFKSANEAIKYIINNPKRGLQEARALAESDIYEMLENLHTMGVGVSVIHGVEDTVFPMQRVLKAAEEKGGMDTIGFYSVKGDHRELSVHPEKYTGLAVNALENLASRNNDQ